jgi:hypothetical protein
MQRRRVQLVSDDTGLPLDPAWQPLLTDAELREASGRLAAAQLPYHWLPLPRLTLLAGRADLFTPCR